MRFPEYQEHASSGMNPIDGYIQYVGARYASEPFVSYREGTYLHAATLFAEGCRQIAVGNNHRKAKPLFLEAQRVFDASKKETDTEAYDTGNSRQGAGFTALLQATVFRNQPSKVKAAREALHCETMEELRQAKDQYDFLFKNEENSSRATKRLRHARGRINELCVTGLFTYLGNHPWISAWPPLTFHDTSEEDIPKNIDAIVVDTKPELTEPAVFPTQVKSRCLGFCGKPGYATLSVRELYDESVILVSGKCDLYNTNDRGKDIFPTAHLLLGNYDEQLDEDQTALLGRISDELKHTITVDNENRRGLYSHEIY